MRSLILAVAAAVVLFQSGSTFAAPVEKVVNRVPVVGVKPVKVLGVGGRVQGTLSKVNAAGKYFEVETADSVVKVPVNAKLKLQDGPNGYPVDTSFDHVKSLAAKRIIIIIIKTPDTVVVIIIRTRT